MRRITKTRLVALMIVSASIITFLSVFWIVEQTRNKDETIVGEGFVQGKEIQKEGSIIEKTYYFLILNDNSMYEVNHDGYYEVEITDQVEIYESGRVVIK
ncbi:MAG: hypothetical protein ACFFG0_54550 [Candidatus Thorarchaeota archaeon]